MRANWRQEPCCWWKRVAFYLLGLLLTCLGVAVILQTDWGLDAWNGVFAGLAACTPLSLGGWSMIVQGSFWVIAALLCRRAQWLCVIPIALKGLFLDLSKAAVARWAIPPGFWPGCTCFLLGYLLVALGTGIYVSTGFAKMPIDGLMLALAERFCWRVQRARLAIELCGFAVLLFVQGPFGGGTVLITLTIGQVVAAASTFSQIWLFAGGCTDTAGSGTRAIEEDIHGDRRI
ncbi:hypothetical protein H8K20_01220 [Neobittarella massiliensis]|uniref:Uncharacterized protein n=1 Tax=Neobittarella massiliensis (ex Bilen et al. 2018) TaxID=2041842 RepID=A0A8J6LY84_9FIRM|nr:hypothetical protein [Neobittarella massiliensis]MBC3515012.1 hypothetical protein [Neobittarella massiliensis]